MQKKPLARHRAVRALAEGARATLDLLADASGRSLRMLRYEAEKEGWALGRAAREDVAERVRVAAGGLLDMVEALGRRAQEEGGRIDKADLDGIIAMIRGLNQLDEIMRPEEAAKADQIRQDEDLAGVLKVINERIVELATELAAQICECDGRPAQSLGGKKRVVA